MKRLENKYLNGMNIYGKPSIVFMHTDLTGYNYKTFFVTGGPGGSSSLEHLPLTLACMRTVAVPELR